MAEPQPIADPRKLDAAFWKRRRGKNIAIAIAVGGFCVLFYAITVVKMIK
jgi:hypothetical protein